MPHFRVIIIGAGIAGCTAARTLVQHGVQEILVLEALDRVGGRVKTTSYGQDENKIEWGARWIHGAENNPLYDELNAKGLLEFKGEYLVWGDNTVENRYCYDLHKMRLDKKTFTKGLEISALLNDIIDEKWDPETDIEKFKRKHIEKLCKKKNLTAVEKMLCRKILVWVERTDKAEEAMEKWDRSEKIYDNGQYDDSGNQDFTFTEGAYSIFEHLLFPKIQDRIRLGVEVSKVDYSCSSGVVQLRTTNGEIYTADHVIITTSVNYLKHNHKQMFWPALPAEKRITIGEIWMGTLEKFMFYYENPFWENELLKNPQFRGYGLLMDTEDESKLASEMEHILGNKDDWWKYAVNINTVLTNPNLLCMELSNDSALQANKCTDEQIARVVLNLLRHYAGLSPPLPSKVIRTNWGTDKYFLGSYSSELSPNFSPKQSEIMMEPVYHEGSPVLLFAGEAYHHKWMSTLHGAYDTGIQQANVISSYLNLCSDHVNSKFPRSNVS